MNWFRTFFILTVVTAPVRFTTVGLAADQINPDGVPGTLIICGGGQVPAEAIEHFGSRLPEFNPPADDQSPPQGAAKDVVVIPFAGNDYQKSFQSSQNMLVRGGIAEARIQIASEDPDTLADQIAECKAVWFSGGQQSRLATALLNTPAEAAIYKLLQQGGTIGGTSAGAAIMSRVMIQSGNPTPVIAAGLNLLPSAIVDQHFQQRKRQPRLRYAISEHPDRFGIGIDEHTAVIVTGRSMGVVGSGSVSVYLTSGPPHFSDELQIHAGDAADLTQLRRTVQSRQSTVKPPDSPADIQLRSGSLIIAGGGRLSQEAIDKFVELAGGSQARIVVLPTASPRQSAFRQTVPSFLQNHDVADVTMLPHSRPEEIASDHFQQKLKQATGIWFGGGRQWRFVDAYEGTNAVELFHDVLRRGGVIAGSSAGATIQGEYLVRGHPLGNTVMMAEGYEQGFSFLPGVAIDQHFTQRDRHADLIPVIRTHPRYLGIGIDESTSLLVQGNQATVMGKHSVYLLTASQLNHADSDAEQQNSDSNNDSSDTDSATQFYQVFPTGTTFRFSEIQQALTTAP